MRRFALTTTLLALTALAACSYVRHERAERTAAHKVFTIEGLHGPESVKYDAGQDAWFISNMVGEGSAKDGQGYVLMTDKGVLHPGGDKIQLAIPLPMHGRVELWQLPEAIQVAGSPAER